jgi:hypothetical protein
VSDASVPSQMNNRVRFVAFVLTAVVFATSYLFVSKAAPDEVPRLAPFSHTSSAHEKLTCNQCHSVPGRNWQKYSKYPDVGTFPYHNACDRCHTSPSNPIRVQTVGFVYCAVCHTAASPSSPVRRFPAAGRSHQFSTIFPHNVHQDLIAQVPRWTGGTAVAHFVNASYNPVADDKVPDFYNCAVCHNSFTAEAKLKFGLRPPSPALKAVAETPLPDTYEKDEAGKEMRPVGTFFKDSPNSHASCFSCHFQTVKPVANDCVGCHTAAKPYLETPGITRYSIKFDHNYKDHITIDCTSCHIRITRTADLKSMVGADVPILACFRCHATQQEQRPSRIVQAEIDDREKSIAEKKPPFQCNYCHTTAIGRFEIPASHRP